MTLKTSSVGLVAFALLTSCGGTPDTSAPTQDASVVDTGLAALPPDASKADVQEPDGGVEVVSDATSPDATSSPDVGSSVDVVGIDKELVDVSVGMEAGARDMGVDIGSMDAGVVATGVDAGRDVGIRDTSLDIGVRDTGVDIGGMDLGVRDTGVDTGVRNTGVDTGVRDTGVDTGPSPLPGPDTVVYTGSFPTTVGETDTSLTTAFEGMAREVDVYVPAMRSAHPPLLLAFHGTGGSGPEMMTDSVAQTVADAYGVIVVAPSSNWVGHGDWDHPTEETYWLTNPQNDPDTNPDVLLVRACIEEAIRAYSIDQNRVYAIGHSSGAFFTLMLSELLQDRLAAFASSSGGLVECPTTQSCSFITTQSTCAGLAGSPGWCRCTGVEKPGTLPPTGRHIPGWLGHGTNDPLVSMQYTCTLQFAMQALGYTVETHLRVGDGHVMPDNFAPTVWPFLSSHVRM